MINHQKSRTCSTDGVEFLGFIFHGYGGQIRVSPKKIKKFKIRVREITRRNRGVSDGNACVVELRRYLQGWVGYFRLVPLEVILRRPRQVDPSPRARLFLATMATTKNEDS